MTMISDMMAAYLGQGDILGALAYFMSNYPVQGFGTLWILMGFAMYAVLFAKNHDYGICGAVLTIYLGLLNIYLTAAQQFFSPVMWLVFALVLGVHLVIMLRKVIMG